MSLARTGTLARSGTRRVVRTNTLAPNSAGLNPPKKGLDDIQQGIKILHTPAGNVKPDVDIVFVPGLGADPERSWQSGKNDFNWIKDPKDGLARDFPKSRILLFQYESAWIGGLRVKQFIYNIAITLMVGLRSIRGDRSNTPVVFVGHSMGGLVIAKAITLADSRRDQFPAMFECMAGCVFFGTPFGGAEAASAASMLAAVGEKLDKATSPKLLEMMSPRDEGLRELKNEFLRLAGKLSQRIEIFCFYEEQPTNFAEQAGLPAIFGIAVPKKIAEFVTRDSATLPGIDAMGLASNHRNLVKFDSPKDSRFQLARDPLKRIIHGSQLVVKNRINATRNVDRDTLREAKKVLDGPDVQYIRKALGRKQAASTWLVKEQEYQDWVVDDFADRKRVDTIWIRGQVGRGKTSNVLAVLDDLEGKISNALSGRQPPLLAYFFCDGNADQSTAEDVLKSFLKQLVEQQELLVSYVKHFVKKKTKEESKEASRSTLQLTIENMWQSIQDMLYDEFVGSTVFFVVNNLHALPEDSPSTQKLLEYIRNDITTGTASDSGKTHVRWLLSSRKADNVMTLFGKQAVRLIDLENEKYEDQVQKELRKHAYTKVSALREEKNYDRDVAYFAHSLIGKRAQNTQWIDIACLQLKALSPNDSRLKVRQILDTMPQDLNMLLENAWLQVFQQNINVVEKLKEMLRAMVLTFEDPTAPELGILAGMSENDDERSDLRQLVEKCKPLLATRRENEGDVKVGFMNIVVKTHLLENSGKLLGLSHDETQWQHGMLAFRAFDHLTERLAAVEVLELNDGTDAYNDENVPYDGEHEAASEAGQTHRTHEDQAMATKEDTVADEYSNWGGDETEYSSVYDDDYVEDDDSHQSDPEAIAVKDAALSYMVKYWLRHAGKASKDMAEDLATSDEKNFWGKDSQLRRRWLFEFTRLDDRQRLSDMPFKSHSSLHIAASVGFPHLVSALIKNGHESEIHEVDDWANTPLHLAAYYDQAEIIDVLLDAGAELDHGKENGDDTPLHMAAYEGFVQVMKKLIARGADIDAFANGTGAVINAAIASGNREAVELLIKNGAKLSIDDHDEVDPPLAAAAMNSDTTLFDYLISACADKLPAREYGIALVAAAGAGQAEVFEKLTAYKYSQEVYQKALNQAVREMEWVLVKTILEKFTNLDCHYAFVEASTAWDDQSEILHTIWRHTNRTLSMSTINDALYSATDYEKEDIVRLLIDDFGADPNAEAPEDAPEDEESYGDALTAAAYDGTLHIVKLLLDKGAKLSRSVGWPLHAAAGNGHLEVVQELIDRGVNVNSLIDNSAFGEGTALQFACEYGHIEIVELLLKSGADANLGGGELAYPLVAAANAGNERTTELLMNAGAQVNVYGGSDRSTPLINAAMWLPIESVKALLDAGAEINASDGDGDSALTAAAKRGDSECIEFLLDRGADIMHTNNEGLNALQLALQEENDDCMQVLVDAVSRILASVKIAVDAGNTSVARVLRSAGVKREPTVAEPTDHSEPNHTSGDDDAVNGTLPHGEDVPDDYITSATEPKSAAFSFDEASPTVAATFDRSLNHNDYSQQSLSDAINNVQQSYEGNRWRNNHAHDRFDRRQDRVDYRTSSSIPPQSFEQHPQSLDRYSGVQSTTNPTQTAIRRKPTPGTSPSPSPAPSTAQNTAVSTPPTTSYGSNANYNSSSSSFNTGGAGYQNTAAHSQNNAYQAYGYDSRPPAPEKLPSDYSLPYNTPPSQPYKSYNSPSYNQPSYQSYTNQPSSNYGQNSTSQQNTPSYNSYDGSDYGNPSWAPPPPLPPRLEQRSSSSNVFGMKDSYDKAKQYGMNRWKS